MRAETFSWDGTDARTFAARLRSLAPDLEEVGEAVADTIAAVRLRGDGAVLELTARFDATERVPTALRVQPAAIAEAAGEIEVELREALQLAHENITEVARAGAAEAVDVELSQGHTVRLEERPVGSAAIYAPGGGGAYPSTVLMGAIAAREAGVERIVVATPPGRNGSIPQPVLAACAMCEVEEVYAMGGAQAIAALALGTHTIEPVDVIAGPGNRYVTEAKRQLNGIVGIDSLAGPSELMVILGDDANLDWIALDLCAQAEHGPDGLLVAAAVESTQLQGLERLVQAMAAERPGVHDAPLALVTVPGTENAVDLANAIAPEHLQLACEDADLLARDVTTAGAVFCGELAATAFGDYVAGSNHVLPTGGAGRFSGPLGPGTFRRRMSLVSLPAPAARELAQALGVLARTEGFPVHAESVEARTTP